MFRFSSEFFIPISHWWYIIISNSKKINYMLCIHTYSFRQLIQLSKRVKVGCYWYSYVSLRLIKSVFLLRSFSSWNLLDYERFSSSMMYLSLVNPGMNIWMSNFSLAFFLNLSSKYRSMTIKVKITSSLLYYLLAN